MTGTALVRPQDSILWELRGAWAVGKRVSLTLERNDEGRIEGHVTKVAPTGAFVRVNGRHVDAGRILAVHLPSRLGDSTVASNEAWRGRARRPDPPQKEELPFQP